MDFICAQRRIDWKCIDIQISREELCIFRIGNERRAHDGGNPVKGRARWSNSGMRHGKGGEEKEKETKYRTKRILRRIFAFKLIRWLKDCIKFWRIYGINTRINTICEALVYLFSFFHWIFVLYFMD